MYVTFIWGFLRTSDNVVPKWDGKIYNVVNVT